MKNARIWQRKAFVACLTFVLTAPCALSGTRPQQQTPPAEQQEVSPIANHPLKVAVTLAARSTPQEASYPDSPTPAVVQIADPVAYSGSSQSGAEQQQNNQPMPVGTAAAPYEKTSGIAASRPAGAAIAPARQRRAHAFLIRVGVVVGVAIAVGVVVALSEGSPSHP